MIIETNKSTERLFPVVPDVEDPAFFELLNELVDVNTKLVKLDANADTPSFLKALMKLPLQARRFGRDFD